jgi:hypothetical protein
VWSRKEPYVLRI